MSFDNDDYKSDFFKKFAPSTKEQKKIDALMLIASKIQKGIKSKRWNKTQFAEAMGQKSLSVVTKWLSGTNNFEAVTLFEIQEVLGIKLFDLQDTSANETISAIAVSNLSITINYFVGIGGSSYIGVNQEGEFCGTADGVQVLDTALFENCN